MDSIKIDETLLIPSGRHTLAPDEVEERQRERLLRAIVAAVAERGYKDATIADVVRVARTSRSAFYEHFANKQACFLEAYEQMTSAFIGASLQAAEPLPGWQEKLSAGIATYFEWMGEHPEVAVSTVVEVRSLVLRRWMRTLEGVAVLARRAGAGIDPPESAYAAIVLTAEAEVHEYARRGRVARVGERAAAVIALADSLYAAAEPRARAPR